MTNKPTSREMSAIELDRIIGGSAGSDLIDLVKTVIHLLTSSGPVTKGLR